MNHQYWVVGSMFGGKNDQFEVFIKRGCWYCWDPKENSKIPDSVKTLFPTIQENDRIAIKRMLGQGAAEIEIRALGIVKAVDLDEWRIYVNWIITDLVRRVSCKNYLGSLHGPIKPSEWRGTTFEL